VHKCHEVKPDFPKTGGAGDVGPALTGMGGSPSAEYFAQSIVDPNAVILPPRLRRADGRSIMPDYRDSLTFAELVDLVTYIKSLDVGDANTHHHEANAPQEQTRATGCAWCTQSLAPPAVTRTARRRRSPPATDGLRSPTRRPASPCPTCPSSRRSERKKRGAHGAPAADDRRSGFTTAPTSRCPTTRRRSTLTLGARRSRPWAPRRDASPGPITLELRLGVTELRSPRAFVHLRRGPS